MEDVQEADAQGKEELGVAASAASTSVYNAEDSWARASVPEPNENSMVGRAESTGTGKGDLGLPANTFTRVKVRVPPAPP